MRRKFYFLTGLLLFTTTITLGQAAWLVPENPSVSDTVTLFFDSSKGNKGLAEFKGDVYFHTGVITNKSIDGGDWKHITGNWGSDDARVKMKADGKGIYTYTFVIEDYYQLTEDEKAQQLAFVFRNADGSKVCKTEKNEDFFIPLASYVPKIKSSTSFIYQNRNYISHIFRGNSLEIQTDHGLVTIDYFTPKIVRIRNFEGNTIGRDSSNAVILEPVLQLPQVFDEGNWLVYESDSMKTLFHKIPFYTAFVYQGDTILSEEKGYFQRSDNNGLRFRMKENEKFYGLGERAISFDLSGNRYELYNRPKYGYEIGAKNLNYSIPLVISSEKYLLLFDNPEKGYADLGEAEDGIFEWGAVGGVMKYFVIAGIDFYDIVENYTLLTGRQPMPARWMLGNLQSRMAYRTQKETDSIISLMQSRDFPVDAVILDFYWFGDSILGTMGRLGWYKPNWPDPKGMISKFRKKGVKTVLITEPYILDSLNNFKIADNLGILAKDSTGKSYINYGFYFGNGALIDIFKPAAQQWFWSQYVEEINIGVAGWWGDLGEPESHPADQIHVNGTADQVHNIYAHYWHKMLFNGYKENYPLTRLFNLNRAGYAGSQRYSIYPWTGDVSRSWGGLQAQLPTMLHMSVSGLPFIHSDAGGFAQGTLDNELYTRWLQMACFSPILRPHGSGVPSEPVYFSQQTQDIVRNYMKMRYRLLPYIYTNTMTASTKGHPITSPLFFNFPNEEETYDISNEYMFGDKLLVVPVIEPSISSLSVYLPAGHWYDFWTNKLYEGKGYQTMDIQIENIPVFVKAGSFIPMVEPVSSTDFYSSQLLTVKYYPGKTGNIDTGMMFEDDGKTVGTIGRGEFEILRFKAITDETSYQFEIFKDGWDYNGMPRQRVIRLEIVGLKEDVKRKISIDGKKVTKKDPDQLVEGYYYRNGILTIEFNYAGDLLKIDVRNFK